MSTADHSDGMNGTPALVTASWRALWEAWKVGMLTVTPVRVSLGLPKFWAQAAYYPYLPDLAPSGWMRSISGDQFRAAYRSKLDRIGIDAVREQLAEIPTDQPLALACFEPSPGDCHRGLLADWLEPHLGRPPEINLSVGTAEQLTLGGER